MRSKVAETAERIRLAPPLPTFATEFALDYHVRNLQYGFIAGFALASRAPKGH